MFRLLGKASSQSKIATVDITAAKSSETLLHALNWIHHFNTQTVVIGLTAGSYKDDQRRQELLTDIYFLASIGARPVIVHGGTQSHDQYDSNRAAQEIAVELNEKLASEYEAIGGRAMTLNFESGAVLQGEASDGKSLGTIASVDRIVVDNLCYAGQTPVIPTMCEGPSSEKILVDDVAAIPFIASGLAAKAAVVVLPELSSDETSIAAGDLDSFAKQTGISADASAAISAAIESGVESVQLVDGNVPHALLLQLFTEHRPGVEIKKVI